MAMRWLGLWAAALAASTAGLAGCLGGDLPAPDPVTPDPAPPVRFVVVGDTGTGEVAEYAVAAAIGKACRLRGCDFLVHTGDILYDVGPRSDRDPQFEDKFERPYGSLGLPVYLVLGNHDVGGNPTGEHDLGRWKEIGDRSVAYANRTDRSTDSWRMPARWYPFAHGNVTFAAFDSSAFMFLPLEADPLGDLHTAVGQQVEFAKTAWPANATWRFAVAHHPYVSNGQHGGEEASGEGTTDASALRAFYEAHVCGKADVLLAGHDHDLQWLQPVPSCGGTRFLVSGAGARPRPLEDPTRHEALFQRGGELGFWWLQVDGARLTAVALDVDARVLYAGELLKPPAAPPA
jgi:tartrate-resistant acid phosphatase type 5